MVHCHSQSAMDLSENVTYHSRTKHIDVHYHWISEIMEKQEMRLKKIHIEKNLSDMMTKVEPREKLELCKELAGMDSK